jgi:hypothetical protein
MSEQTQRTFEEIDGEIQKLSLQKFISLEEDLNSKDPDKIIKAVNYLNPNSKKKDQDKEFKSYIFSPENEFYTGLGYKNTTKSISFDMLRRMSRIPAIYSIISTRIDQIRRYCQFTLDDQEIGWTIRRKLGRFDSFEGDYKPTQQDKRAIEAIADFLENGGFNEKWSEADDFEDFIIKFMWDSLSLDQAAFECERNRKRELIRYMAQDAAMMRLLETIDPDQKKNNLDLEEIDGYKPIYCQVYNNKILQRPETDEEIVYYPWELCLGIRNKSTDIRNNGYGISELEILIEVVTWILWGMQYNGNFFKQGSNPKGFFALEDGATQSTLNEFRSIWRNMVMGVQNAHKTPVFEGGKVSWTSMQQTNKDMEFSAWNEFLLLIACSVYKMDPSELGWQFKNQAALFGQDGQQARLQHSKEKGFKPLMVFLQKRINKFIVTELDDKYEFVWTGIDLKNETEILDNDIKRIQWGGISMEDFFMKNSGRKFDPEKDTILNTIYQQAKQFDTQSSQFGGQESNEAVDKMNPGSEGEGAQNPFAEYEKAIKSDPITSEVMKYVDVLFKG